MNTLTLTADAALPEPLHAKAHTVVYHTPRSLLLAIFAIAPLCLLTVAADQLFFGGWLRVHLPRLPESLFIIQIIFAQPHIMASTITFFDKEYLRHYGKRLLPAFLLLAGIAVFFPDFFYTRWAFGIFFAWTMAHVVGQQFGLRRMMGIPAGRTFLLWRWLPLVIAIPAYFDIYELIPLSHATRTLIKLGICGVLALFLVISCFLYRSVKPGHARRYLFANAFMLGAEVLFYCTGYYFFFILSGRVIHDVSAFVFYVSHDANRNAGEQKNYVYRFLRAIPLPVYLLCPLLAIAVASPYLFTQSVSRIWLPIAFFHYYTDSFIWKKGSPHREYIHIR